jgi:FKBP-type peptidyl-prolyl cis-trans isomerase SlyD
MTRLLMSLIALLVVPIAALAQTRPAEAPAGAAIAPGSNVQIEYTLREQGGPTIESSKGRGPVTFTHGQQQLLPRLERELLGMRAGEEKTVVVKPEDAYGTVDPTAVKEVPKSMMPPDSLKVGLLLLARDAKGEQGPVRVKEIKDSTVVLDLNHPLAGKTLEFDVRVLSVTPGASKPGN